MIRRALSVALQAVAHLGNWGLALLSWVPGAILAGLLALAWLAWWWAGEPGSLQRAVGLAKPFSTTLQSLNIVAPTASLRHGGAVQTLHWQGVQTSVHLENLQATWQWDVWRDGHRQPVRLALRASTLAVQSHEANRPSSSPNRPLEPQDLTLPWPIDATLEVDTLTHSQWPGHALQGLKLRHGHHPTAAGGEAPGHRLQLDAHLHSQGKNAAVQTAVPYTLRASLGHDGTLLATLHAQTKGKLASGPWHGDLVAEMSGQVFGAEAALEATARLTTQNANAKELATAKATATLHPWKEQPLQQLTAHWQRLDLSTWVPGWPRTVLGGQASVLPLPSEPAATTQWQWTAVLDNTLSGPWDQGRLPLAHARVEATFGSHGGQVQRFQLQAAGGTVEATGRWQGQPWAQWANQPSAATHATSSEATPPLPSSWQGTLQWRGLHTTAAHSQLPAWVVSGQLAATPDPPTAPASGQAVRVQGQIGFAAQDSRQNNAPSTLARPAPSAQQTGNSQLVLDMLAEPHRYQVVSAQWSAGGQWQAQATGTAQRADTAGPWHWSGQSRLRAPGLRAQADLAHLAWPLSLGTTSSELDLELSDLQQLERAILPWLRAGAQFLPNVAWPLWLEGAQGSGRLRLKLANAGEAQPTQLKGELLIPSAKGGGNQAGQPGWHIHNLQALASGSLPDLQTEWRGQVGWNRLSAELEALLNAQFPAVPPSQVAPPSAALVAPVRIQVPRLLMQLGAQGTPPIAQVSLTTTAQIDPVPQGWRLSAGGLKWQPLGSSAAKGHTPPTHLPTTLSWQTSTWQAGLLSSEGELNQLHLATAHNLLRLLPTPGSTEAGTSTDTEHTPLQGNLTLAGQWQVRWPLGAQPHPLAAERHLQLHLQRTGGDLALPVGDAEQTVVSVGLRDVGFHVTGNTQRMELEAQWQSQRLGQLSAQATVQHGSPPNSADNPFPPEAVLSGHIRWADTNLGLWSGLAPPGWRLDGLASVQARLGGTVQAPHWEGDLQVRQLGLRSAVEGLAYENGELTAQLTGQRMAIRRFRLEGAGGQARAGTLEVQGHIDWPDFTHPPRIQLDAKAEGLQVSTRADRRLALSGQAQVGIEQGVARLRGQLRADRAHFRLPDETAPAQGSDVVVRMTRKAPPAAPAAPGLKTDVDVSIDLGPAFTLEGLGVDTRLQGQLRLSSPPSNPQFSVVGEVQTVRGTYRAYGQRLQIDQGVLRFSGPYDDPALDILALRAIRKPFDTGNDAAQEVGVHIGGSGRQPVVRLYAKPDMPDADKLSWLLLGRSASGAGAQAAVLQQAAMALLAGSGPGLDASLARSLGLDEVAIQTATSATGNATEGDASLLLGKRLTDRLYVAYEHSLSGSLSAVSLLYDLSRRLTLRARTGQTQALDLIATVPHD